MQLLKDINYKKMITNRITVTTIMILLELALLLGIFWRAVQYSWLILGAFSLLSMLVTTNLPPIAKTSNPTIAITVDSAFINFIIQIPFLGQFVNCPSIIIGFLYKYLTAKTKKPIYVDFTYISSLMFYLAKDL